MGRIDKFLQLCMVVVLPTACTAPVSQPSTLSVAQTLTKAQSANGDYISWVEHRIDDEGLTGVAIRGGDGLKLADLDGDGIDDVVSVHEDSHHLRIAYASTDPDLWRNLTVAKGAAVGAIEDVAVGDINGDGRLDLITANEEAHLAYFQNPGGRSANWPHLVIPITQDRGSWLQVALQDMDGDGQLEVLGANKGFADVVRLADGESVNNATTMLRIDGDPLRASSWQEQVLMRDGIPNQVLTADMDNDGDADVLAASRLDNRMMLLLNDGVGAGGELVVRTVPIEIAPGFAVSAGWRGASNAFNAVLADFDGDGRKDILLNVIETSADTGSADTGSADTGRQLRTSGLGWLSQPDDLTQPWLYHRVGSLLPDLVIGVGAVDVDGDGDLDAIAGGYSGLNALYGGYSGHSRDVDDPRASSASTVARIAWFENPGDARQSWTRHDISRRVRGMYDEFAFRDLNSDGAIDIVATRGNSGEYDGVFWLEQRRTKEPLPAMQPARLVDSASLPLPPADWRSGYPQRVEYVAPNKAAQKEALKSE